MTRPLQMQTIQQVQADIDRVDAIRDLYQRRMGQRATREMDMELYGLTIDQRFKAWQQLININ